MRKVGELFTRATEYFILSQRFPHIYWFVVLWRLMLSGAGQHTRPKSAHTKYSTYLLYTLQTFVPLTAPLFCGRTHPSPGRARLRSCRGCGGDLSIDSLWC